MTSGTVEAVTEHLRLRKYFDIESAAHPLVRFYISLYTTVPVRLILLDRLPTGVTTDEIAFNPDYHGDCWSVATEYVRFECSLDWGETVDTAYAVAVEEADLPAFLLAPAVRLVDPAGTELTKVTPDMFRISGDEEDDTASAGDLISAFDRPEPPETDAPLETDQSIPQPPAASTTSDASVESTDGSPDDTGASDTNEDFLFDQS
ncbi:MAG: hypothetical protein SVG88_07090 [Halobacteriales archaeon]|nr:hypothetical protein [Halobacteriales archaeon]